jgi:hypothetical protein
MNDLKQLYPLLRMVTNGEWFKGQTTRGGGAAVNGAPNTGC